MKVFRLAAALAAIAAVFVAGSPVAAEAAVQPTATRASSVPGDPGSGQVPVFSASDIVQVAFDPLTTDRTAVDIDHRDVSVHGRLTGRWPTGEVRPLAGFPVTLIVNYLDVQTLETGQDGTFSGTLRLDGPARIQAVYRHSNDRPFFMPAESDPVQIQIVQSPTRLTGRLSDARILEGESVTISGRLTWRSRGRWRPLASAEIGILFVPSSGGQSVVVGPATTDAKGRYLTTVTPAEAGTLLLTYQSDDPFKADASTTTREIRVAHPSAVSEFTAVRDASGTVVVQARLAFPGNFSPADPSVDVEFSRSAVRWTRVATRTAYWDGMGYGFVDTFLEPRAGYWRINYRGTPDFQPTVSDAVFVPAA